jgi:hypothetical protein
MTCTPTVSRGHCAKDISDLVMDYHAIFSIDHSHCHFPSEQTSFIALKTNIGHTTFDRCLNFCLVIILVNIIVKRIRLHTKSILSCCLQIGMNKLWYHWTKMCIPWSTTNGQKALWYHEADFIPNPLESKQALLLWRQMLDTSYHIYLYVFDCILVLRTIVYSFACTCGCIKFNNNIELNCIFNKL